jgi:CrcB protein
MNYLLIGAGSCIGGMLRFGLSQWIQTKTGAVFPYGTLGVNLLGCFLIGLVFGWSERTAIPQEWRLFLTTGLLGGFTTFSAFSNETVGMLRSGWYTAAALYVLGSVLPGIGATFGGYWVSKAG